MQLYRKYFLNFFIFHKYVKVYQDNRDDSRIVFSFDNVPTVKPKEEGYYEVLVKETDFNDVSTTYPVARFPIFNTNMIIEK